MRASREEVAAPKYAHIERERRWLVATEALTPVGAYVAIQDRYITGTRLRLRAMTDSVTGDVALKLTKKYEAVDPRARPIVTAYLTPSEFEIFASIPAKVLAKRRYQVDDAGRDFSVDVFTGGLSGLVLAEIEWPDDAGLLALIAPLWAGREVSDEVRYQGGSLAALGIPGE